MRINPCGNLTVWLIRRRADARRLCGVPSCAGLAAAQLLAAQRLRLAPRCQPAPPQAPACDARDLWRPAPWPFDTPQPIGLPPAAGTAAGTADQRASKRPPSMLPTDRAPYDPSRVLDVWA